MASAYNLQSSEEIVRRSIEALDAVIDEFDGDLCALNATWSHREDDLGHENHYNDQTIVDPVQETLDILDTVLAHFENQSTEFENAGASGEDETDFNDLQSDPNDFSPVKHFRRISPPPVPKRSPTTCLSCSSSAQFDCPSPEIDPFEPTFASKKSAGRKVNRLSSKPVRRGSRPHLKATDNPASQEISDEDEVFQKIDLRETNSELDSQKDPSVEADPVEDPNSIIDSEGFKKKIEPEDAKKKIDLEDTKKTDLESRKKNIDPKGDKKIDLEKLKAETFVKIVSKKLDESSKRDEPEKMNDKFVLAKLLLDSGRLIGLDEKPPSFRPPAPPNVHVTSVKIPQGNVSVISIEPKTMSTFSRHPVRSSSPVSKGGIRPLELNKEATRGAVFFNIYQSPSDSEKEIKDGRKKKKKKDTDTR